MIETEGLTHIQLAVRDVHRALGFYTDVFGMEVKFWEGESTVFLGTPGRRDVITLTRAEDAETAGAMGGIAHIGFRLVDKSTMDNAIKEVVKGGGVFIERGCHAQDRPYAYVRDPDGYVIEL